MVTRPCTASPFPRALRSCCSFTEDAVGLTELGCCAPAGAATARISAKTNAPMMKRACASNPAMPNLPDFLSAALAAAAPSPQHRPFSGGDGLAIRRLPAPSTRRVAALGDPLLEDLRDDLAVTREQRLGRAHLGAQRQLAFGETVRAVLLVLQLGIVGLRAAGAERALVHLAARSEVADLRVLWRAERAGVEAVAAADAQVFRVQHHRVGRGVEAVYRADRRTRRVGAVHASHRDRALAGLAVIDRDDATTIHAPRHLVLVLAGGDAGVALDATIGVAEEFHTGHGRCSLSRSDLTEGCLGFLHAGHRVVAVRGETVDALTQHDRIGALRIVAALILAAEPAREVERTPGHALAHAFGHQRLHAGLG